MMVARQVVRARSFASASVLFTRIGVIREVGQDGQAD